MIAGWTEQCRRSRFHGGPCSGTVTIPDLELPADGFRTWHVACPDCGLVLEIVRNSLGNGYACACTAGCEVN